jgi:hypothetical protein
MVKMHFHVSNAKTDNLRYAVKEIAPVFFLRIEETVLWALARGVSWSILGNSWPSVTPPRDATQRGFNGGTHAHGFVVIGDGNPGTPWLPAPDAFP